MRVKYITELTTFSICLLIIFSGFLVDDTPALKMGQIYASSNPEVDQIMVCFVPMLIKQTGSFDQKLSYNVPRQLQEEQIELKGKTKDIYDLLANNGDLMGVREIQRHLEYSSPNLAFYHLNKLYLADLVLKTPDNKYQVNMNSRIYKEEFLKHTMIIFGRSYSHFLLFQLIFVISGISHILTLILHLSVAYLVLFNLPLSAIMIYYFHKLRLE